MSQEFESAEQVRDAAGRQYHIGLAPGEVAPWILMVGDPKRARRVAELFDAVELERSNREYLTLTGTHRGVRISVMGTGMSAANTEIAVVELLQCMPEGVTPTMIRCGSSGALQPEIALGDLVITQGACRLEMASSAYVTDGFPAVASTDVVLALAQAAEAVTAGDRSAYHVGLTATAAGFYGAQGRRVPGLPPPRDTGALDRLATERVLNFEMEASCLLTLATLCRFRAGAVCAAYASRPRNTFISSDDKDAAELRCITTGLTAIHNLIAMDQARGARPVWHPGLA
ncbi:MAG: nucleoside phosphorylase [Myxococcales bacterium]|nr:nucleoside phosphorylase [Myxococcales bacterium]